MTPSNTAKDAPAGSIRSIRSLDDTRTPAATPGYRNGESEGPRAGSPARDMTTVHIERSGKEMLDFVQAYKAHTGHRLPLWRVLKEILETSPLYRAALEADRVRREWEAREKDRSDRSDRLT